MAPRPGGARWYVGAGGSVSRRSLAGSAPWNDPRAPSPSAPPGGDRGGGRTAPEPVRALPARGSRGKTGSDARGIARTPPWRRERRAGHNRAGRAVLARRRDLRLRSASLALVRNRPPDCKSCARQDLPARRCCHRVPAGTVLHTLANRPVRTGKPLSTSETSEEAETVVRCAICYQRQGMTRQ